MDLEIVANKENKITFSHHVFISFFCILFIIEPKIFTQYNVTAAIFGIINVIIFLYFICYFLFKNIKISKFLILWWSYRLLVLFLMLFNMNSNDIDQWGLLTIMVSNFAFLIEYYIKRFKLIDFLLGMNLVGIVYLSLNIFSLFFFENGIISSVGSWHNANNDYYFLGIKDSYTTYVVAFITSAGLYYKYSKKFFISILIVALSLVNIFVAHISTGIIIIAFILFAMVFMRKLSIKIRTILLIFLAIHIVLLFFNFQNIFGFVIEGLLDKDVTLSSRVYIWDSAIDYFKSNPFNLIIGKGIKNGGAWVNYAGGLWQPHNSLLSLLYEGGLIGLVLFFLFLSASDKIYINSTYIEYKKIYNFLLIMITAVLISSLVSNSFNVLQYYVPFVFIYYIKESFNYKQYGVLYE